MLQSYDQTAVIYLYILYSMTEKRLSLFLLFFAFIFCGCINYGNTKNVSSDTSENKIIQKDNGVLALNIEDAACYSDIKDPSVNTAEWEAIIVKSGRYNLWLSSITNDTTTLHYENPVHVNFRNVNIEKIPKCDVILSGHPNEKSFFRADSFLGSVYIQDTGNVNIQIICEKILTDTISLEQADNNFSKFISLRLVPENKKN